MLTLESNTEPVEQLTEALVNNGFSIVESNAPDTEAKPGHSVEENKEKTEKPGEPGDKVSAEPGDKSAAATEVAEPKTQETTTETEESKKKDKPKGGFQAKIEKKTLEVATLRAELEAERGDKTRLRERLEEAEAKLVDLKSPVAAEPEKAGPTKPKRPEMPDLADFDYDAEKYKTALKQYRVDEAKYQDDYEAYRDALTAAKVEETLANERASNEERKQRESAEKADREFVERKDKGKQHYEDFDAVIAALPNDAATILDRDAKGVPKYPTALNYVLGKTKNPADLIYYFAVDILQNGGEENKRIMDLDQFEQAFELRAIEQRIIAEREGEVSTPEKKETPKTEVAVATETPKRTVVPPPVEPKPKQTPTAPIGPETVAGRASATGDTMEKAAAEGRGKDFLRLMNESRARKLGQRV